MIIKNGQVFLQGTGFAHTSVGTAGDRITSIGSGDGAVLDASGKYVLPGFVDIHMHGANNSDFCDGTREALVNIARYEAQQGVTSFLGTCMATYRDVLVKAFTAAGEFIENPEPGCAVMRGINMEGPFLSKEKRGAHIEECCIPFNEEVYTELRTACRDHIRIFDICPEYEGAMDAIREISKYATVSLAHSSADYDLAEQAYRAGATHLTHIFNAMMPFNHRNPGLVGAAIDYADQVEMICDGIHLHPSVLRTIFRLLGKDERVCIISDSMRAAGLSDGTYELGGQTVYVKDGKATLENGTIAGAAVCQSEAFRRLVSFGVPLEHAVMAATHTPARAIRMDGEIGSIAPGLRADFTVLNEDLTVHAVVLGGVQIR
ncbi:MAG: N-acetylglucosamine-6-phosphate deacetylase [Oscillospiraceae bacterium]|nr:N-acetylglucosamine-6-phosphate deacetylase [Oscillospiraceae bacterium]